MSTRAFEQASIDLDQAVTRRMREAPGTTYAAALSQLEQERDPAFVAFEEAHPNQVARRPAFVARGMREDGLTRGEASEAFDVEEKRLSTAESGRIRLSGRLANEDVAFPVSD